jgi:hypothetical protein
MVLPRKNKSIKICQRLNNSTKKRLTTVRNSKQKLVHTKRKKLTKVIYLKELFNMYFYSFDFFSVWI